MTITLSNRAAPYIYVRRRGSGVQIRPFNGEDCWAYPAYLAVQADLTVVADQILAGDPIVVADPSAAADRCVGRVRIAAAARTAPAVHTLVRIASVARTVPAVHISVRSATAAQIVPVVHISVRIATVARTVLAVHIWVRIAALLSLEADPNAPVDRYVVVDLNVVRSVVRNAVNEVQIAPSVQFVPDVTVSLPVRRTVQIEAFPIPAPDCLQAKLTVDGQIQFFRVDRWNAYPRHRHPAGPVERPSPVACLLFLADALLVCLRSLSATQELSLLIATVWMSHLQDLKLQES
jgi:hypothetical protein